MRRADILRAVFFPNEKVADQYQTTVITTRAGQTIRGLVTSETAQNVVVVTAANPSTPSTILKSDITQRTTERTSIMAQDLADQIEDQNVANVVAFLMAR